MTVVSVYNEMNKLINIITVCTICKHLFVDSTVMLKYEVVLDSNTEKETIASECKLWVINIKYSRTRARARTQYPHRQSERAVGAVASGQVCANMNFYDVRTRVWALQAEVGNSKSSITIIWKP